MSERYKSRYEVIEIIKANVLKGLEAFGLPTNPDGGEGEGWRCFEAEQPSFKNLDQVVALHYEKAERVGWQGATQEYNEETGKIDVYDSFIEQQEWRISVIHKRSTAEISEGEIPQTTSDIAGMLIAWFNRLGCLEFRKHNCGNLFIQMKDVKSYKSTSDVSQWISEFPLKLQVPKTFVTEIDVADVKMEGMYSIRGGGTLRNLPFGNKQEP